MPLFGFGNGKFGKFTLPTDLWEQRAADDSDEDYPPIKIYGERKKRRRPKANKQTS